MKWISLLSAFVVALGMNAVAQADLFDLSLNCGAAKSCECASTCQPESYKNKKAKKKKKIIDKEKEGKKR